MANSALTLSPKIHRHHGIQPDVVEAIVGSDVGGSDFEHRRSDVSNMVGDHVEPVSFRGLRQEVEYRRF